MKGNQIATHRYETELKATREALIAERDQWIRPGSSPLDNFADDIPLSEYNYLANRIDEYNRRRDEVAREVDLRVPGLEGFLGGNVMLFPPIEIPPPTLITPRFAI